MSNELQNIWIWILNKISNGKFKLKSLITQDPHIEDTGPFIHKIMIFMGLQYYMIQCTGIIPGMGSANERRRYYTWNAFFYRPSPYPEWSLMQYPAKKTMNKFQSCHHSWFPRTSSLAVDITEQNCTLAFLTYQSHSIQRYSYGFLPDTNQPFPEPILTCHEWGPVSVTWGRFHVKCPSQQLFISGCKSHIYVTGTSSRGSRVHRNWCVFQLIEAEWRIFTSVI